MISQILSLLGMGMVLSGYFMVTYLQKKPTGLLVSCCNVLGSILLLATALLLLNVGYAILNIAWIGIAIISYRKARQ
jgi:hypothetical protein